MHLKWGISVMFVVAMLVAGCGSSNDSSEASSAQEETVALTKPQYVQQANAICTEALKEKDEAVKRSLEESAGSKAAEEEAGEAAAVAALPAFTKMVDQLDKLGAPEKDQAKIDRMIGQYEKALKQAEADPSSLVSGNPFIDADKAAMSYGLEACNA